MRDVQKLAMQWVESWNSHNLEIIMNHYSDDIEITTPMIKLAAGIENGSLKGKLVVANYWKKALEKFPDLHFELVEITSGVDSIALYYKSIMSKMAVEVMFFNEDNQVCRMIAHYSDL